MVRIPRIRAASVTKKFTKTILVNGGIKLCVADCKQVRYENYGRRQSVLSFQHPVLYRFNVDKLGNEAQSVFELQW